LVCVLEQLHRALVCGDVFAFPSHRWSGPRASPGRARVGGHAGGRSLGLSLDRPVEEHLAEAGPTAKVSIEVQDNGRVRLHVARLGARDPRMFRG
jgi:hypothetical protein